MAPLTAFFICSLDLRVADASGDFGWAEPSAQVHAWANEQERAVGTHLYGRRMWETMRFWETMPADGSVMGEYGALWRESDHVVYSTTLDAVDAPRARLERRFEPEAVRALKAEATALLTVGGADLAGQALRAGLVDRLELLLVPVVVGEGPRAIPDGFAARLSLLEQTTLDGGWVHLVHAVEGDL